MKALAFEKANQQYEAWLRKQIVVVERDLRHKYKKMRKGGVFTFLRGTFYRWVILWEAERKILRAADVLLPKAPEVLVVGDLHLENFGTWRDAEGRLIWGINDFDEACRMKYVNDLVRLGTSVYFALRERGAGWSFSHPDACTEILKGYADCLDTDGTTFILAQGIPWLWKIATDPSRTPEEFWTDLEAKTQQKPGKALQKPARQAARALARYAPKGGRVDPERLRLRQAGVGSLGRPRFVYIFDGPLGRIVREAKVVVPSAAVFNEFGKAIPDPHAAILRKARRIRDPFMGVEEGWLVRRLSYDNDKIELKSLDRIEDVRRFFRAMGAETANIHLGSESARALARHFAAQCDHKASWLSEASVRMAHATERDFQEFEQTGLGKAD